jgi:thiamine kinase-like enzyme
MDARIQCPACSTPVTRLITPEDALSRIPGWDGESDVDEISGGLTNRSFVVRSRNGVFILRLDAGHTKTFGLDRSVELKVLREAANADIAPKVRFADPDAGILLYEYLPGPVWDRASLDDRHNLERLSALLRSVHSLPASGAVLDGAAAADRYAATASVNADLRRFAAHCVGIVRAAPPSSPPVCCHNDVVAANIIGTSSLKLLDWEYACDNDPYFDLASLIAYHDLGSKHAGMLLDSYAGGRDAEAKERLQLQLRIYDAIQWLWLAARYVIDPSRDHRARLDQLRQRLR